MQIGAAVLKIWAIECSGIGWLHKRTGNAWHSRAVTRHAQGTQAGEDPSAAIESSRMLLARRYLQRGRSIPPIPRGCCESAALFLSLVTLTFDFWPRHLSLSVRRTKYVFRMNLVQIRSAVPAIHPTRKACLWLYYSYIVLTIATVYYLLCNCILASTHSWHELRMSTFNKKQWWWWCVADFGRFCA